MQYNQDIYRNIIRIDISKVASYSLILAIISFFMHLMLHNYNGLKKNSLEETFYTRQILQSSSTALNVVKDTQITNSLTQALPIENNISQQNLPIIEQIKPIEKKIMTSKRIGNVLVVSMSKGDTLINALKEAQIPNPHAIADAINKKYKLNNIKAGDILQIGRLSKNTEINLRLVLLNKVEILIREKRKKYIVLVKDLQQKKLQKKVSQQHTSEIKTIIINQSHQSIHKSHFTNELKRDLAMIIQLLKHNNIHHSKLEVIYEKISNKNEKLLYVNLGNIKIYKYRDKNGIVHYVKDNGMILSNKTIRKSSQIGSFKLAYPINNPVIGSGFGVREHPIMGGRRMHKGIDFRACKGTPIKAPADGIITQISIGRGFGKHVRIRHNGVYTTLYAHLDNFAKGKKVGMKIRQGDIIGYVGKTGIASGEHLHFEVHENGRPINPMRLISNIQTTIDNNPIQLEKRNLIGFKQYQSEVDKKIKSL